MKVIIPKSDTIGILASSLCMLHCIATPFVFFIKTCSDTCCSAAPTWWHWIDILFLVISLFSIYHAVQNTSKKWIKYTMWMSWILLFSVILNEQIQLFSLFENAIYIPALSLIILHFYNLKYCKCAEKSCSTDQS
jgi:hypothetical protein